MDNPRRCQKQTWAQRKFAQGYQPPLGIVSNNNTSTTRDEQALLEIRPPKTIKHAMSAMELLDFVSFKNLHQHDVVPVVVLERMKSNAEIVEPPRKKIHKDIHKKYDTRSIRNVQHFSSEDEAPLTYFKSLPKKNTKVAQEENMKAPKSTTKVKTQPLAEDNLKHEKKANGEKEPRKVRKITKKPLNANVRRNMKRKCTEVSESHTANDDNTNIRLRKNTELTSEPPATKQFQILGPPVSTTLQVQSRTRANTTKVPDKADLIEAQKSKNEPEKKSDPPVSTTLQVQSRTRANTTKVPDKADLIETDKSKNEPEKKAECHPPKEVNSNIMLRKYKCNKDKTNLQPPVSKHQSLPVTTALQAESQPLVVTDTIKKPEKMKNTEAIESTDTPVALHALGARSESKLMNPAPSPLAKDSKNSTERILTPKPMVTSCPTDTQVQVNVMVGVEQSDALTVGQSHSSHKSYKSIYANKNNIEKWIDVVIIKEEQPDDDVDSMESRSVGTKVCPSVEFTTVQQVIAAPQQDLERRCRRCSPCRRVDKVISITNLVRSCSETSSDVYSFEDVDEGLNKQRFKSRRAPLTDPECNTIYLDLLPKNSPHLVRITLVSAPNRPKQIMRASLMARSLATESILSMVDCEHLLDQLLDTLSLNQRLPRPSSPHSSAPQPRTSPSPPHRAARLPRPPTPPRPRTPPSPSPTPPGSQTPTTSESGGYDAEPSRILNAPVFHPTPEEFKDPIAYFEKIMAKGDQFAICKIVAPKGFEPTCTLDDMDRFNVINQYIVRLYNRWGPATREMCAIKAHLSSQSVVFSRAPLVEGMEVNLPKLFNLVQQHGGLKRVIEKKRWGRIADEMRCTKLSNPEKKFDQIYVKYLLPYDTMSSRERQQMLCKVEKCWNKKNQKILDRAVSPLHQQKKILSGLDSSGEESSEEEDNARVPWALSEAEDCIVQGRSMNLPNFRKIAANVMATHFPGPNAPSAAEVEQQYWKTVMLGTEHICVNTASIDTGEQGYGFTTNSADPMSKHPWNLKVMSKNKANMLRFMGPVVGVTVPTLHLGMLFSTSCWHRDPHGLPWVEYMHNGPSKIWYGIPDGKSEVFRKAVETLCPSFCLNKTVWLPSDITMIPPNLLVEHGVTLCRLEQNPGEFILVLPKAYSCSISTGYNESESVYFATGPWFDSIGDVFGELKATCEPTMFALEHLLLGAANAKDLEKARRKRAAAWLQQLLTLELTSRRALVSTGMTVVTLPSVRLTQRTAWNVRHESECEICRSTLYLSGVKGLPSSNGTTCPTHALHLLNIPKHKENIKNIELHLSCSDNDLNKMLAEANSILIQ